MLLAPGVPSSPSNSLAGVLPVGGATDRGASVGGASAQIPAVWKQKSQQLLPSVVETYISFFYRS